MKRRRKGFLVVGAVALLTFGTLMATFGKERYGKGCRHHCGQQHKTGTQPDSEAVKL